MSRLIAAGVDIGGSHITVALVDLEERKVLEDSRTREKVNSHGSTEEIIAVWSGTIRKACASIGLETVSIGIGMPGPMDYERGTCFIKGQDKYESLYGLNVKMLLAEALNINSGVIRIINDAACFLQGEAFGGVAKGFSSVIGLTLGTGLGSSVYKDYAAMDADLWNSPYKNGIAEDYLSTRWFLKRYKEITGKETEDVKFLARVSGSDPYASQVFIEFGENLGLFLNRFINEEKPEAVVLGGNISHAIDLFRRLLREALEPAYCDIPVLKAVLGEDAAILGASSLWYVPQVYSSLKSS